MKLMILAVLVLMHVLEAADAPAPSLPNKLRGDKMEVTGSGFQTGATDSPVIVAKRVTLVPFDAGKSPLSVDNVIVTGPNNLTFTIPTDAKFGRYTIQVLKVLKTDGKSENTMLEEHGSVNITAVPPRLDSVIPRVLFLSEDPKPEFTVIGSGFTEKDGEYSLHFLTAQSPAHCPENDPAKGKDCYVTKVTDARQLTFTGVPGLQNYPGRQKFTIVVDDAESPQQLDITLTNTGRNDPRWWALVFLAILMLIIFLLIRSGKKNIENIVGGRTYLLQALFLDKQTNTYSLSQCQFYAWTGAAVLGYIYLLTSKSLIQNSLTFPDIPTGLPGILLASAGTGVLSAGIANMKGDKGSGEVHPSLSDFITTGGVVAAERLQFVVWTIVGVATFIRLVFLSDPATIDDLPKIPDNFLQLMGISSAGYLAGKLARKAGPTLTEVAATDLGNGALQLTLNGSGLSQSATFSIGGVPIPAASITGPSGASQLPDILQKDETNNEPGAARVLKMNIANALPAWFGKNVALTITNPDGQKAVWHYTIFGITSASLKADTNFLTIKGWNLNAPTVFLCQVGMPLAPLPVAAAPPVAIAPDTITATMAPAAPLTVGTPVRVTVTHSSGSTDTADFTVS